MENYSGPERRDGAERRKDRCAVCEVLWSNHDHERDAHRKDITEDIQELKSGVEKIAQSMTPWKVFALSMVVLIGSIGWLATEIKSGNTEIKSMVERVHVRISTNDKDVETATAGLKESIMGIKYSVESIDGRLKQVEKALEVVK